MNKMNAYLEILQVMSKYDEVLKDDYQIDIRDRLISRIKVAEISEEFGIDIPDDANPNWTNVGEYASIGMYGKDYNRTVSWLDGTTQPENERLYCISFPTGPYIFGDHSFGGPYLTKTFQAFFDELKTYSTKYSDSHNRALYFTKDTAAAVHEAFQGIYDKHMATVHVELKAMKVAKLKAELESLEEGK